MMTLLTNVPTYGLEMSVHKTLRIVHRWTEKVK